MKRLFLLFLIVTPLTILGQSFAKLDALSRVDTVAFVYFKSNTTITFDTIPCVMLITECDVCRSLQISGYRITKTETMFKGMDRDVYYTNDRKFVTHLKCLSSNFADLPENVTVWLFR